MKRDYSNLPEHLPTGKLAFNDSTNELFIGAGENAPLQKVTDMDIHDELNQASIDYSGEHHENLKDSMDANVDFIMGEFNSTQMTGEFITAQNTLPRHIKRAELRGHTEVNLIQEPSGQDLVLPYEFEDTQSLTLEDTKESGAVNIVLKGNTEVNVLKNPMRDYVVPYEFEEGYTATLTDTKETGSIKSAILKGQTLVNLAIEKGAEFTGANQWKHLRLNQRLLNSSKKYLVSFDSSQDYKGYVHLRDITTNTYITGATLTLFKQGNNKFLIKDFLRTELNTFADIRVTFYLNNDSVVIPTISNVTLLEYVEGMENWDIPYFEGMQSVKMPVLKTTGKNLFDVNIIKGNRSVSTGEMFIQKGYATTSDFSPILSNQKISFSLRDNEKYRFSQFLFYDENKNFISNSTSSTTTTPANAKFIHIGMAKKDTTNDFTDDELDELKDMIQIEYGDKTSYEPYKTNILTTTSKNLFDMNRPYDAITDSQATVTQSLDKITVSSAESGIYVNANFILDKDFFAGKTVTGSCLYESDEKDIGTVQITYQDGNGEHHYQWIKTPRTFTFPNSFIGDVMLSVSANNTGTPQSNTVIVKNIQLELGSTATPYEPYSEVVLRGIGDVKDTLDGNTGEWTQRIGEVVLDGSENWSRQGVSQNNSNLGIYYSTKALPNTIFNTNNVLCDKFKTSKTMSWHSSEEDIYVSISTYGLKICFDERKLESTTVEGFKKWLSENTPTIQYPLVEKPIKTVDLSILDQDGLSVPALSTYNEVTHISTSSQEGSLLPSVSSKIPEFPVMIKPSTKYSIVADTSENGHTNVPLTYHLGGAEVETEVGNKVTVITTPSTLTNETFKVTGTGMKLSNVMILEKDLTGKEIPNYTEGINSAKVSEIKTTGKNIAPHTSITRSETVKDVTFSSDGNIISMTGINTGYVGFDLASKTASANLLAYALLSPTIDFYKGKKIADKGQYTLSSTFETYVADVSHNGLVVSVVVIYDDNKRADISPNAKINGESSLQKTFIVEKHINGIYVGLWYNGFDTTQIKVKNIQLEKSSIKTNYEPYKSNILTVNEDVTLRGIGDVQDTLDCLTGEVTERIGEMILDGSEDWSGWSGSVNELTYGAILTIDGKGEGVFANDRLIDSKILFGIDEVGIWNVTDSRIVIRVNKIEGVDSVSAVKSFLKNEPITIQYQLATPTIKTVDLNIINQNGQKVDKLSTFNGVTYVESSVAENSLKPIISHKDLEYEVLLKPNTKYSIITNPISNGHTNSPISFDLGGQQVETTVGSYCTLVTTPSTLTHDKLVMKGKGNQLSGGVMIFEGDKTGMMFSHFDGMKSVENPVFKTVGKNLFDSEHFCCYLGLTPLKGGFLCNTHTKKYPFKTFGRTCMTVKHKGLEGATPGRSIIQVNYVDGTVGHTSLLNSNYVWEKPIDSIQVNSWQGGPTEVTEIMWYYVENNETTYLSYEPYESNTLSLKIPMRSLPNGVCDTLDLITGEYVQNVGYCCFKETPPTVNYNGRSTTCVNFDLNPTVNDLPLAYSYAPQRGVTQFPLELGPTTSKYLKLRLNYDDTINESNNATEYINYFNECVKKYGLEIQYQLGEPITTKLDLAWEDGKLFAYDGTTHFFVDVDGGHLQPVLDIDVPVNIVAELSRLRAEKEQLESYNGQLENQLSLLSLRNSDLQSNVQSLVAENSQLKLSTQDLQTRSNVLQLKNKELKQHQEKLQAENVELQERASQLTQATENLTEGLHTVDAVRESGDLELLSSDFDLDFRLMEIEFALDIATPMSLFKGVKTMARTPYEMAKTLILGGKYDRADMEYKLGRYLERKQLTQEQYDELMALIEATDLVG